MTWFPLSGLLLKWGNKDLGAFTILLGLIFTIWFFFGAWYIGISGVILLIFGVLLILPKKS